MLKKGIGAGMTWTGLWICLVVFCSGVRPYWGRWWKVFSLLPCSTSTIPIFMAWWPYGVRMFCCIIYIYIFLYIYLFINQRPKSRYWGVSAHQRQRKKVRRGKGLKRRRRNLPPQPGSWGAHRRCRTEQKKENRDQDPNPTTLEHLVASYDPQGSFDKPILLTPWPSWVIDINSPCGRGASE